MRVGNLMHRRVVRREEKEERGWSDDIIRSVEEDDLLELGPEDMQLGQDEAKIGPACFIYAPNHEDHGPKYGEVRYTVLCAKVALHTEEVEALLSILANNIHADDDIESFEDRSTSLHGRSLWSEDADSREGSVRWLRCISVHVSKSRD